MFEDHAPPDNPLKRNVKGLNFFVLPAEKSKTFYPLFLNNSCGSKEKRLQNIKKKTRSTKKPNRLLKNTDKSIFLQINTIGFL